MNGKQNGTEDEERINLTSMSFNDVTTPTPSSSNMVQSHASHSRQSKNSQVNASHRSKLQDSHAKDNYSSFFAKVTSRFKLQGLSLIA